MRPTLLLVAAAAASLWLQTAKSQADETSGCAAFKWPIATEQQLLAAPGLPALASGGAFPALGQGASVALVPQGEVAYTVRPARAPKSNPAHGAEVTLPAGSGGTVQVTLSAEAWVDVVQGGKVLRSTAFSGRTGCPGIRKSVRFTLAAGPAAIAISDAADTTIKLAILPGP